MSYPGSCSGCGRQWDSLTAAHCTLCHHHFSTVKNFDLHEPNRRRGCKDPASLIRARQDGTEVRVLKPVQRSDGETWVSWSEDVRYAGAEA
jgi:hypothetical protein